MIKRFFGGGDEGGRTAYLLICHNYNTLHVIYKIKSPYIIAGSLLSASGACFLLWAQWWSCLCKQQKKIE